MIDQQLKHKLKNFPPIFVVSVKQSTDRRSTIYRDFQKYGLEKNVYWGIFDLWDPSKYNVTGSNLEDLHIGSYGPATSHILINKIWTENTNYDEAIIIEDDCLFDFVKYWNFTWGDFYKALPKDWGLVQLAYMRENPDELKFEFKKRYAFDFGCQIYLVKRHYAEEIVRRYWREDGFDLNIPPAKLTINDDETWENCNIIPIVENIVYESIGNTYNFPLFYEKVETPTLSIGKTEKEDWRNLCLDKFTNFWVNVGETVFF